MLYLSDKLPEQDIAKVKRLIEHLLHVKALKPDSDGDDMASDSRSRSQARKQPLKSSVADLEKRFPGFSAIGKL